ncbi:MAG TPA: peptidoglycan DD-metalloendopeptidase family protein [Casimicrobiaceae bacterium]|nr:peptidoglycan DD-metalloendopeptidase family protein [Casimicrobiaceae bacterium]
MRAHELRILSQPFRVTLRALAHCISPGQALAIAVLGFAGVAAFGITPDTTLDAPQVRTITRALPLPSVAITDPADSRYWREERVERGDTIGSLLARASVVDPDALAFLRGDASARALYQLQPGRSLQVATDDDGRLAGLRFLGPDGELLSISRTATGFVAARAAPPDDTRLTLRGGEIQTTLFAAADAAKLPDSITIALADIFGGEIDFYHDLRRGDRFAVLYETRYVDGEPVGTGRVVAAEFASGGRTLRAFLWRSADGTEGYYNDDGRNSRNAFLRSPMEFSRVTSGFTLARLDPVLHTMRAHKGIDFAAPVGTPVRATADGVVTFVGQQTGYGNVIMLKHDGRYSTVYAHLSRFAVDTKDGARVRQGQTIGFVGQTGWATGPHLHYELRVDDEPRDPLTVALPMATPITDEQRPAFASAIAPLAGELAVVRELPATRLVAAN